MRDTNRRGTIQERPKSTNLEAKFRKSNTSMPADFKSVDLVNGVMSLPDDDDEEEEKRLMTVTSSEYMP